MDEQIYVPVSEHLKVLTELQTMTTEHYEMMSELTATSNELQLEIQRLNVLHEVDQTLLNMYRPYCPLLAPEQNDFVQYNLSPATLIAPDIVHPQQFVLPTTLPARLGRKRRLKNQLASSSTLPDSIHKANDVPEHVTAHSNASNGSNQGEPSNQLPPEIFMTPEKLTPRSAHKSNDAPENAIAASPDSNVPTQSANTPLSTISANPANLIPGPSHESDAVPEEATATPSDSSAPIQNMDMPQDPRGERSGYCLRVKSRLIQPTGDFDILRYLKK